MQEICYPGSHLKLERISEFQLRGLYLQHIGGWPIVRSIKLGFNELEWDKSIVDPDWDTEWLRGQEYKNIQQGVCRTDLIVFGLIDNFVLDGWYYSECFVGESARLSRVARRNKLNTDDAAEIIKFANKEYGDGFEFRMLDAKIVSLFPRILSEMEINKFALGKSGYVLLQNQP